MNIWDVQCARGEPCNRLHRGTPCQRQWELEIELLDSTQIHVSVDPFGKKDAKFPHWIHVWYILRTVQFPSFYFMENFKEKM